jgi:adenine-specific DNA-methyltransferase
MVLMNKPEKLKMHTTDISQEKFAALASLFPHAVTETIDSDGKVVRAIDADILAQEINSHVVSGKEERYQFTWPDKRNAMLLANAPIAAALRPCRDESVDFDTTKNLYIEGDNLDVLKLLRETYLNRVKMIYIDPPYNTGNDFVYEDDFAEDTQSFLQRDGQYDQQGNRLTANTDSNGRFHTDWLNMIYPRLRVARDLLTDDGVIFISIDDNEVSNLRKACDEIFGEENFIDVIYWKKKYGGGAKEKYLVSVHEYILFYCKNKSALPEISVDFEEERSNRFYKFKDENYELRGFYRTHPLEAVQSFDVRENLRFPIKAPDGTLVFPKRQWRWSKARFDEALSKNEVVFTKNRDDEWVLYSKQYINDENGVRRKTKAQSVIDDIFTQEGTKEIKDLFGDAKAFSFPKPTRLIKKLLEIGGMESDSLILDFFSGSATTAHAVMQLNAEDCGNRQFIMVQVPEITPKDSEANKAGYATICEIGKERIRRAGQQIKAEIPLTTQDLDIGFRVLKLDSSNMQDVYYTPNIVNQAGFDLSGFQDNIKPDRTSEDLLFQVLLDLGIPLSAKITQENQLYLVDENYLIACFEQVDHQILTEIAKKQPYYAVFRDSSFADDSALVNLEQIFNSYSPNTIRKVL